MARQPQPAQPQQQAQPPSPVNLDAMVGQIDEWYYEFRRAYAGFSAILGAYQTVTGTTPEGARLRGVPVFEYSAPIPSGEKVDSVKCCIDLKNLSPTEAQHVFVPLLNLELKNTRVVLDELAAGFSQLSAAMPAGSGQPQAPTPAPPG